MLQMWTRGLHYTVLLSMGLSMLSQFLSRSRKILNLSIAGMNASALHSTLLPKTIMKLWSNSCTSTFNLKVSIFNIFTYTHIFQSLTFTHSHLQQTLDPNIPDLHADDKFSYTPVILAAEANSREAFQFFMNCIGENGIKDVTKNPLFQALNLHDKAPQSVKVIVMKCMHFAVAVHTYQAKFYGLWKQHFILY